MALQYEAVIRLLAEAVKDELNKGVSVFEKIPVGISNRHVHLSKKDSEILFGKDYEFTNIKDLSQIGQYACKESIIICGPKASMEKVRIIGPVRGATQVELLKADCIKLGIPPVLRLSGDISDTPGLTLIGPKGSVQIKEGAIVAKRHIHMTKEDALRFNVTDGEIVDAVLDSERGGVYTNVIIRVSEKSKLELHLDTEEANAMGIDSSSMISLVKKYNK